MRVFVYEHITGGGLLDDSDAAVPSGSLLREGTAMVVSLATDFAALDDVEVTVLENRRLGPLPLSGCRRCVVGSRDEATAAFAEATQKADWTVVIAPEMHNALADCCGRVGSLGGRLLGPELHTIELASDKHAMCEHLQRAGVSVPEGIRLDALVRPPADFDYPAVVKPLYGAGSEGVRYLADATAARRLLSLAGGPQRLERYCPGLPVSVAILCGPRGRLTLPGCRQDVSDDGRFRYRGGSLPLSVELASRAATLAERACDVLGVSRGYVGVDMILGPDGEGGDDFVIEVNARLTTSYVGLRAATDGNLALAMVQLADGEESALSFTTATVQFQADGTVSTTNQACGST